MPAAVITSIHGPYRLSTDASLIDVPSVHRYLASDSYWAQDRPFELVERSIAHSHLVVGAYGPDDEQVGFARMVTDLATYGYLCDVYVLPAHQGAGLGTAIVRTIVEHPDVVGVKWQFLATRDAHDLYRRFGYTALDDPARWMHRRS